MRPWGLALIGAECAHRDLRSTRPKGPFLAPNAPIALDLRRLRPTRSTCADCAHRDLAPSAPNALDLCRLRPSRPTRSNSAPTAPTAPNALDLRPACPLGPIDGRTSPRSAWPCPDSPPALERTSGLPTGSFLPCVGAHALDATADRRPRADRRLMLHCDRTRSARPRSPIACDRRSRQLPIGECTQCVRRRPAGSHPADRPIGASLSPARRPAPHHSARYSRVRQKLKQNLPILRNLIPPIRRVQTFHIVRSIPFVSIIKT